MQRRLHLVFATPSFWCGIVAEPWTLPSAAGSLVDDRDRVVCGRWPVPADGVLTITNVALSMGIADLRCQSHYGRLRHIDR